MSEYHDTLREVSEKCQRICDELKAAASALSDLRQQLAQLSQSISEDLDHASEPFYLSPDDVRNGGQP